MSTALALIAASKEILDIVNASIAVVASLRRQGMTNEELNVLFDKVDAGGPALTLDDAQAANDRLKEHLAAARQIK